MYVQFLDKICRMSNQNYAAKKRVKPEFRFETQKVKPGYV